MLKQNRIILPAILALALGFSQVGCENRTGNAHTHPAHSPAATDPTERAVQIAVAELQPTEGSETRGTVTFTQTEGGIHVVATVQGMTGGAGNRGFHIHQHGDCSAPDATSAGGHFNPFDMPHGGPDDDHRHAGDFGNLEFNEEGVARAEFIDTHISFSGPASIIGRSVIIHFEEDDLETQPTGDAGGRAACGVIEVLQYAD